MHVTITFRSKLIGPVLHLGLGLDLLRTDLNLCKNSGVEYRFEKS